VGGDGIGGRSREGVGWWVGSYGIRYLLVSVDGVE